MIAPNFNFPCRKAELYYYDFLHGGSPKPIPEPIIDHIEQCQNCQDRINQLKKALLQMDGTKLQQNQENSAAVTEMLKIHFAYIGKKVTCKIVRPFLPSMLDPTLEIRIPTPITTHLDKCRKCSEDLETIRNLKLNNKQLCRLSQLFADKADQDNVSCLQAQATIFAVVLMHFQEANKDILKHLCVCPDCRQALYEYRDDFRNELLSDNRVQEDSLCEQLSFLDIYDYVIPYGLDPANDQYAKFRQPLVSHIRICPTCLAKMQQLHNTIYEILERAESEVVTVYNIDESGKAQAVGESDNLYHGFPITVENINSKDESETKKPNPAIATDANLKQKAPVRKLTPLLRTAIATAAVILIGIILLLNVPTAKAFTIKGIYKAIEEVKNVHIASFVPNEEEPVQEIWISRTSNIYMNKTGNELVLWDITNRIRKTKHLGTGEIDTTEITDNSISSLEIKMSTSFGLMPFYSIAELPTGAEWIKADKTNLEVADGIEVYELFWTENTYSGSMIFKKWRVFADENTNLPQRVEWYQKSPADSEYTLGLVMAVKYLSDSEMQDVVKGAIF